MKVCGLLHSARGKSKSLGGNIGRTTSFCLKCVRWDYGSESFTKAVENVRNITLGARTGKHQNPSLFDILGSQRNYGL